LDFFKYVVVIKRYLNKRWWHLVHVTLLLSVHFSCHMHIWSYRSYTLYRTMFQLHLCLDVHLGGVQFKLWSVQVSESGEFTQYSGGWMIGEFWFHYQKGQEIFLSSLEAMGPTNLLFNWYQWFFSRE
jgi:hypothetical protein